VLASVADYIASGLAGIFGALGLKVFNKRVSDFGPVIVGDASCGAFHVLHEPVQIITRMRNADHTKGGAIPQLCAIELRHGNIEAGSQTVLEAADHLAPILDGLRGFDVEFEGKESDHAGTRGQGSGPEH